MARKILPALFLCLITVLSAYQVDLLSDSNTSTRFEVNFGTPMARYVSNDYWLLKMDGFGHTGENFGPKLFGRNFQIAVPRDCNIDVIIEDVVWSDWMSITPAPNSPEVDKHGIMGEIDPFLYAMPQGAKVELNGRRIVRGVEIADIFIEPVHYDPEHGVRFMRNITVSVNYEGGGPSDCGPRLYNWTWENFFRGTLVNPDAAIPRTRPMIAEWDPTEGAELLAIVRPDFEDELQDRIDWKLLMGFPARVVTTSITGTDTASIKAYIQNAYNTWTLPPSFVLLVADADYIPVYQGSGGLMGDNHFGTVDGSDIFPDIFVSRISVDYTADIVNLVLKHLNYEKNPDTTDDWYSRYVGIVNEDDPDWEPLGPQDSSYLAAVTYGMTQCSLAGFTSHPMFRRKLGHTFSTVRPYVEAGLGLVQYRGQAYPDYYYGFAGGLDTLDNNGKCPVNISISCGTGGFMYGDTRMCERTTRARTATHPKGGTAFIGQALVSSNSEERSSLSKHVYEALFEAKINEFAAAHLYGKNELYAEFGGSYDSRYEFLSATALGSPDMLVWTGPIDLHPTVTYPLSVTAGPNNIDVHVARFGANLENARVALHQGSQFSYGKTNASGDVTIALNVDAAHSLIIVVTGPNIYPQIDTIDVIEEGVAVYSAPAVFNDSLGNRDGLLNPGETVSFRPGIFNIGTETSTGLTAVVRCNIPIVWIDSTTVFPNCAPDDTVYGDRVEFYIPDTTSAYGSITFTMHISGGLTGPWNRTVVPQPGVHRFAPGIESIMIIDSAPYGDGDGILSGGEVADLAIRLRNNTQADAYNVVAHLLSIPEISVINSYAFVDVWPRTVSQALFPIYTVSVSPSVAPGTEVLLPMVVTARCSIYDYHDTLLIPFTLNGPITSLPTGPDAYGYYIYEDVDDHYPIAPTYEWLDISTLGSTIGPITNSDDGITTIGLPFAMRFYGVNYDSISVSSNGFMAPGRSTWSGPGSGSPQTFPYVGGPQGVVAAGWADLAPHRSGGGEIYSYNNTATNQFIIQWDACQFYYGGGMISTQLRICNPSFWPTPTGDSEIFLYYELMSGIGAMGIGIESQSQTMGLQYYLNGAYDHHAVELEAGRALRITTQAPSLYSGPWLFYISDLWIDDSLANNNRIIEPGDRIGIKMRIKNGGTAAAVNAQGDISATARLTPYGSRANFGYIPISGNSYNNVSMYCDISPSCPSDTVINVPINLYATGGYSTLFYIPLHVGGAVSVNDNETPLPKGIQLGHSYPNPFNSSTSIEIFVGDDITEPVIIDVYDITGRKIDNLHDGFLKPGRHNLRYEPVNTASGVYFLRMRHGNETVTRKMVLIE